MMGKSTSPRLSDTTFFARCPLFYKWIRLNLSPSISTQKTLLLVWRWDHHFFMSIKATQNAVPSFLSYSKTLSIGPVPGSNLRHSALLSNATVWANPLVARKSYKNLNRISCLSFISGQEDRWFKWSRDHTKSNLWGKVSQRRYTCTMYLYKVAWHSIL